MRVLAANPHTDASARPPPSPSIPPFLPPHLGVQNLPYGGKELPKLLALRHVGEEIADLDLGARPLQARLGPQPIQESPPPSSHLHLPAVSAAQDAGVVLTVHFCRGEGGIEGGRWSLRGLADLSGPSKEERSGQGAREQRSLVWQPREAESLPPRLCSPPLTPFQ
jgi:hypothetical protein